MADLKTTNKRILIGCTGSVATIKLSQLVSELKESAGNSQVEIRVVATQRSKHFFKVKDIPEEVKIFDDESEWDMWKGRGDPVLHIDLAKWADIFVIAPLDANTLAKIAQVGFSFVTIGVLVDGISELRHVSLLGSLR